MIELRKITKDNLEDVLNLEITEEQKAFVSTPAHSLAQAWAYRDTAFPFAIYADEVIVGFVMLGYYEIKNQYTLWKFLIDEQYQGKGYGKDALKLAIKYIKDTFDVKEIYTGVAFGNEVAKNLYYSMGFRETGEVDETQIEMRLDLTC